MKAITNAFFISHIIIKYVCPLFYLLLNMNTHSVMHLLQAYFWLYNVSLLRRITTWRKRKCWHYGSGSKPRGAAQRGHFIMLFGYQWVYYNRNEFGGIAEIYKVCSRDNSYPVKESHGSRILR
jgi:hypothetical protein